MSLQYKVLWIDDNLESAEVKADGVKEFLEEEGFDFERILRENANGIEEILSDPELDIVITDFNLDIDIQKLIKKVRKQQKYIEIVMYSENPPRDFHKISREFDGVYTSIREEVEETIINVIKNTIRRTQNLNNMRGIVISEAIDIESQIENIIISYFHKEGDLAQKVLRKSDTCDFNKKIGFLGSINKKTLKKFNIKMNESSVSKSEKRKLNEKIENLKPLVDVAKKLVKEVAWPRNVLAHVKPSVDGNGEACLQSEIKSPEGDKKILVNSDWYKETRKNLRKHSDNLKNIAAFLEDQIDF